MRISDWSSDVCSSDLGFILTRLDTPDAPPIAAIEPDRPLAIGSAFKLVILAELVREIAGGKRHWDDPITLDGGDLPGGFYADKAKGTIATIRDLATKMVSVSDNSATDRSEEHTSELQSLMRNSYAVFCLNKKRQNT